MVHTMRACATLGWRGRYLRAKARLLAWWVHPSTWHPSCVLETLIPFLPMCFRMVSLRVPSTHVGNFCSIQLGVVVMETLIAPDNPKRKPPAQSYALVYPERPSAAPRALWDLMVECVSILPFLFLLLSIKKLTSQFENVDKDGP